jgi:FkbM family methyltransferase
MKQLIKRLFKLFGLKITKIGGGSENHIGSMTALLKHLKNQGLKCESILDVGANKTNWSRMAKTIFPKANFYLIEPQIEMEAYLKKFTEEYPNSLYFLQAVGAKNEIRTLTIWDDFDGSSLLPKEKNSLLEVGKQRKVKTFKIDTLIENKKITQPNIIKLDIQGFEIEALKGAEKTFGLTEVYILEVSLFSFSDLPNIPIFTDVINFMLNRDYVVYDFPGFLRRPLDGALGQCDICFVKKNSFLRSSNDWK